MPRTDPPPPKKQDPPNAGGGARPSTPPPPSGAVPGKSRRVSERPRKVNDDIEITVEEVEITLGDAELGDSHLSGWMTTDASENERATLPPPMPEHEYVAKMMEELPDVERIPASRAITPIRGLGGPPSPTREPPSHSRPSSVRGAKQVSDPPVKGRARSAAPPRKANLIDPTPPLTLDLSDSLLPIAVPSPVPLPNFERPSVPKFDTLESAPTPSPSTKPRNTLPSAQGALRSGPEGLRAVVPSSEPRFSFGPAAGDALELVGVRAESVKPEKETATMLEVNDRFDVGDFSGALALASKILESEPEHVDALLYAEHCRDVLKQMYISNLGGLRRVPQLAVSPEQLRWLALDHRAGFLLSLLDGRSTFDELLDVCGMPPFEAIRLLVQLLQQNVIRIV